MENNRFFYVNIRTYLDDSESLQYLNKIIEEYSCPLNYDVEHFLKVNAVDFATRNQSVSYLVFSTTDGTFLSHGFEGMTKKYINRHSRA